MGINYYRNGDKIEIVVRDGSGGKIETLECSVSNKKKYAYILSYLKEKYGFEPEIKEAPKKTEVDWWE